MRMWVSTVKLEARFLILAGNDRADAEPLARDEGFSHIYNSTLSVEELVVVDDPSKLASEGWRLDDLVEHNIKGEGDIKLARAIQIAIASAEADAAKAASDDLVARLQIPLFPSEP